MHEILFRGKRVDTGEWVEGYYVGTAFEYAYIAVQIEETASWETYPVDPSTVGQYTGLSDKNGKRIFEGDIFAHPDLPKYRYSVEWELGGWLIFADDAGFSPASVEIIGSIHDNPEQMGGTGDA